MPGLSQAELSRISLGLLKYWAKRSAGPVWLKICCGHESELPCPKFCVTFFWGGGDMNRCLFIPDRTWTRDQRNNSTQVQCGEPVHLLELLIGVWVRGYRSVGDWKAAASSESPSQRHWRLMKVSSLCNLWAKALMSLLSPNINFYCLDNPQRRASRALEVLWASWSFWASFFPPSGDASLERKLWHTLLRLCDRRTQRKTETREESVDSACTSPSLSPLLCGLVLT